MCRLLVGLPDVAVRGVADDGDGHLEIVIELDLPRPVCIGCDQPLTIKQTVRRQLVDLPCFGRRTTTIWLQRRWHCRPCRSRSWTESAPTIVADRHRLTDRAARWATGQVGRHGRAVSAVADDLGCDWHTVNDAVLAYGQVLIDDPDRIADVTHLGMDEACQVRRGPFRIKRWSSQVVGDHRLLDVVEGRDAKPLCDWLAGRPAAWRDQIATVTIDMSGSYLSVAHTMLPEATVVADKFHVVKNANERLDECRRRVQQQVLQRRGHRDDPLYRSRRVLVMADERLSEDAKKRRTRLLDEGDPRGEVRDAWLAKESVRELYTVADPDEAADWVAALATDMQDRSYPPEVRKLGRMLDSWGERIVAWHRTRASNAATEAINNLAKRVKRVAFGIVNWHHWRTRVLLYAGGCDWSKLATLTPLPPRSRTSSAP